MSKVEKRNFRLKMNLACGTDELRPVMSHVYFDNGFMVATDAYIIVKAAVQKFSDFDRSEVDILNGKFLHKDTFKKILSVSQVAITEEGVKDLLTNDVYKFSTIDAKYPNYDAVIPRAYGSIKEIGINPSVAGRLMKVLSCEDVMNVKLNFVASNRGICVTGMGENEGSLECVLMPVMIDSEVAA